MLRNAFNLGRKAFHRSRRYRLDGVTKGLQERSIDTKLVGSLRMGARAVDWARLESVCTARYRGFESLPIRQISPYSLAARKLNIQLMPN
jgi:hypothetical protein